MKKLLLLFVITVSASAYAVETDFGDKGIIQLLQDQPNYFLLGRPQTKAQLSFKLKAFSETDLYLAYTQKIFWDLFEDSSPFRDVNYNPSVFYRFSTNEIRDSLIDVIAYEHESNGKAFEKSRSWDRSGVRYQAVSKWKGSVRGIWSVRAWVPYWLEPTNADLAKYRGVCEVSFTLADFLGPYFDLNDLTLKIYPGGSWYLNPLLGGQELTLRIKGKSVGFLANAVIQVFQGYGENMLEYNQRVFGLRAGIGF